jgi:hypothetical protein
MQRISVNWHGEIIGHITDSRPDMWYLEGQWHPAPNSHTDSFLARAASLDPRAVIAGTQRGLVVTLHEDDSPGAQPTLALVCAPPAQTLFVRRVYDPKAVELARSWEKEEI